MAVLPPDPVFTYRHADHGFNCLCFHRSERLIGGTTNGSVHLFDLQTNRIAHRLELPEPNGCTSVHHHDETLFVQQRGGLVSTWTLTNAGYEPEHTIDTGHTGFCRIEVVAARDWLLCPLADNSIGVFDLRQPDAPPLAALRPPGPADGTNNTPATPCGHLMCFKHLPIGDQDYVLGCYESGDFVTWDLRAGNAVLDRQRLDDCPMTVDYDAHTNRGVFGGPTDRLGVFGYSRNTMQLQRRSDIALKTAGVNCVRIRGDRRVFSAGGWDGRVRVFSWSSLRPLAVLTEHRSTMSDITYTDDRVALWNAPIMATASMDGQIALWDLYN